MELVLVAAVLGALGIAGLVGGISVMGASRAHKAKVRQFLTTPLSVDAEMQAKAKALGIDGAAVVGVSTFDVLYNTMKMDGHVLTGIDRLHHAREFSNLGELMTYLKEDIIRYDGDGGVLRTVIHKYKGYTGEEQVFDKLAGEGHEIEIPVSGTQPGYDVLVDGKPYNVKVTDNPRYIQEHLDNHPDIDVITNSEMAAAFADDPRVLVDENLSVQETFHLTNDTLDAVGSMGDLLDQVPYVALAINSVRHGHRLYKGEIDWKTAVEHTTVDTTATGVGGFAGGKLGLALGLMLAPATGGASAVAIPAATTLIGTLAGVLTGKAGGGWIKQRHLRTFQKNLDTAASELAKAFLRAYDEIEARRAEYFNSRVREARRGEAQAGVGLRAKLFPSTQAVFYQMAQERFWEERDEELRTLAALKVEVAGKPAKEAGLILIRHDPAIYLGVEPLPALHASVFERAEQVEAEQRLGIRSGKASRSKDPGSLAAASPAPAS